MPKRSGPVKKQPTFDWKSPDKYIELGNFDEEMMIEKSTKVATIKETNKVTTEQVLHWTKK